MRDRVDWRGRTPGKARAAPEKTAVERQIDALVYEHYGLTEDEIRIVEKEILA